MSKNLVMDSPIKNDSIMFKEEESKNLQLENDYWNVMVVDDDMSVHTITKIILKNFSYENRRIKLINAYSASEAKQLLDANSDIAVILLDIIMEDDFSGLEVVKYIRESLNNNLTRIILRTGQPGSAPEKKIFIDYDINDYKLKTELSEDKLYVAILSSIRSYKELILLDNNRKGLERIIKQSANFYKIRTFNEFSTSILAQLSLILNLRENNSPTGFIATICGDEFIIVDGIGDYLNFIGKNINEILSNEDVIRVKTCISEKKKMFFSNKFVNYLESQYNLESLIYYKHNKEFDILDKNLIDIFSNNISMLLDNLQLTGEIKTINTELETTQREIIFTLGEIAEARSKETSHHVKRVSEYLKILALKYGLSENIAEQIKMAAPMHDIGKLAIPDYILNKPGKLTLEEFEIMKTHSKVGYDMLKNSHRDIMKIASIIALQHHEKYNGTGYPEGLKGDQIHIYGRMAAIADVFDALGSDRVYKKAWPLDQILDYFKLEKGSQFDPILINLFFENLDAFIEIKNQFSDV